MNANFTTFNSFHTKNSFVVENITYLCTKVNIENETAVNHGCYKQMRSGHEIEVCVCESWAGRVPCNSGNGFVINIEVLIALSLIFCLKRGLFSDS